MSNVQTYRGLLEEKALLEATLAIQKGKIIQDLESLSEEYRPTIQLLSKLGKITNHSLRNPLVEMLFGVATGILLPNSALNGSSKLAGMILPILTKKITGWFGRDARPGI